MPSFRTRLDYMLLRVRKNTPHDQKRFAMPLTDIMDWSTTETMVHDEIVTALAAYIAAHPDEFRGEPGEDGANAYQVAVAQGFVGTVAAWMASLAGAPGSNGRLGSLWTAGAGSPSASGLPGDLYLDTANVLTINVYGPLLAIGASYSITAKVTVFR
jgi:hypothetical protein